MTEETAPTLANGGRKFRNEIASVHVFVEGQELTFKKAAKQLRLLADMVEAGMMGAEGFNWSYGGEYELTVELPASFPHGDYQDGEGNLVHIGNDDMVINVTWANKDAAQEDVADQEIHAFNWIQEHGPLRRAGSGEAEGHTHDHGHGH